MFLLFSVTLLTVLGVHRFVPFLPSLQDMLPRCGMMDTPWTVEPALPRNIEISVPKPVEHIAHFLSQATASQSQGISRNGYFAAAHAVSVIHSTVPVHRISQRQAGNQWWLLVPIIFHLSSFPNASEAFS